MMSFIKLKKIVAMTGVATVFFSGYADAATLSTAMNTFNSEVITGGKTVETFLMLAGLCIAAAALFGIKQANDRHEPIGGHLTALAIAGGLISIMSFIIMMSGSLGLNASASNPF